MEKILIIEDDAVIAAIERDYLEMEGFAVKIVPEAAGKAGYPYFDGDGQTGGY